MSLAPVDSFASSAAQIKDDIRLFERRRAQPPDPSLPRRQTLGRTAAARATPVEIAFLANYGVPEEALQYAAATARRQGVCADEALLAEGIVPEDLFYRALADYLGVEFVEGPVELAASSVATANRGYARLRNAPRGVLWLFAPSGGGVFRLMSAARAAKGRPLFAVTTRMRFIEAVRRADPANAARSAAFLAERADKELCVRGCLRRRPLGFLILALFALVACLFAPFTFVRLGCELFLACAFLANVFLRLFACAASFEARDAAGPLNAEAQLPIYTLVIALYKEAAVARQLARAIDRLDYPRAKLDVKFVIEADDEETAMALRAHPPRAPHEIVVAPEGAPRTKPRALNVAMPLARGALVAVFDAEDLPEPRQLRRAATLFATLPRRVGCLQASLVIDNGALNWMTALFALEYAALFDVYNKGLAAMGLPLFLGGTSNHFRGIRQQPHLGEDVTY